MSETINITTVLSEKPTMREFFDFHKVPYCLVRHEIIEKDGVTTKKMIGSPPKGWIKHSYETMMALNEHYLTTGATTLVVNLRKSKFCVLDADNAHAEQYLIDNYETYNFSESISKGMTHMYLLKHTEDTKGQNKIGYKDGLDLIYDIIFERLDGNMYAYEPDKFIVFDDYKSAVTHTPATELENKDRTYDPTIIDLINKSYFEKGSYSDWLKICWGIIYCWGEIEGRLLCLKYSASEDYTEQETNSAVEKMLNEYNPSKGITYATLCYYAKLSDLNKFKSWQKTQTNHNPLSFKNLRFDFEQNKFVVKHPLQYVTELKTDTGEIKLDRCCRTGFSNKYENIWIEEIDEDGDKLTPIPFMKCWLSCPQRRTYEKLDFIPRPLVCPKDTYNLYTGMQYEKITVAPDNNIEVFLDHLRVLSGDDQTELVYKYQLNYLAHMLQKPGELPKTAILWNSPPGAGKNLFIDGIGKHIIGTKYTLSTENAERFVGKWRDTNNKFLGVYNEASSKDTFGLDGKIKALITEPTLDWEEKNEKAVQMNSFIRMFFLTNKDNGVRIDPGDRRFQVIEITKVHDREYFERLGAAFENPAKVLGFANYLLNVDISTWQSQDNRVMTDYYTAMKSINIPYRERWVATLLNTDEIDDPTYRWKPLELYKSYTSYMNNLNFTSETNTMFGRKLKHPKWAECITPIYSGKCCRYYIINKERLEETLITHNIITTEDLHSDEDEVDMEDEGFCG